MGMFDTIYLDKYIMEKLINLGYPSKDKNDFQTKDLECTMNIYALGYSTTAPDGISITSKSDYNTLIKRYPLEPYPSLDKEFIWLEYPYHGKIEIHNIVYDTYYSYNLYFRKGYLKEIKLNEIL